MHFADTDAWFKAYPKKQLLHLHYGTSTTSEEESTAEAQWVYDCAITESFNKHPDTLFTIVVDMTRGDNSEFPSEKAIDLYKEMLKHDQNGRAIFYGVTHAMKMVLQVLFRMSGMKDQAFVVESKEEADALYQEWYEAEKKII